MIDPITSDVCTFCGRLLKASELGSCSRCRSEGDLSEIELIEETKMNPHEMSEMSRIAELRSRLELLQADLAKGYKRTQARRKEAWVTVIATAQAQLQAYAPAVVPETEPLPLDNTKSA